MNYDSFSLEQELALRMVSIQTKKTTDITKLQEELIELIEKILIKQQKFNDIFHCPRKEKKEVTSVLRTNQTLASELKVKTNILAYTSFVKKIDNVKELQGLLIEANEICMIQKKYSHLLPQ